MRSRRLRLLSLKSFVLFAVLTATIWGSLPLSVAAAHPLSSSSSFTAAANGVYGLSAQAFARAALLDATTPPCNSFPIALNIATIAGAQVGDTLGDIYNGTTPGNFGWLSWTGDPSEPALVTSLTLPGNSDMYVNPNDPTDHMLAVGDWVSGKPGVSNSKAVRDALTSLEGIDLTVPVWDETQGNGSTSQYHVAGFVQVQITAFQLPGANRITAIYLGNTPCGGGTLPPPSGPSLSGATLTLSPSAAGPNVIGTTQTLTATLKSHAGVPIPDIAVQFTISGPNAAMSNGGTTNSDGIATYTYEGDASGTDSIQATATSGQTTVTSNTTSVSWVVPAQPISTGTVSAAFYPSGAGFRATPQSQPAFTQVFPAINFDPPAGTVPGTPAGVNEETRPLVDVVTDASGHYVGSIVAQGNGFQAGEGTLFQFDVVLTGTFTIGAAGDVLIRVWHDDGVVMGIGNGATHVSGPLTGGPASGVTPFEHFPVVGANGVAVVSAPDGFVVHFPAAGSYPYEFDWNECCGDGLKLAVLVGTPTSPLALPSTGTLTLSPASTQTQSVGNPQNLTATVTDAAGAPVPNATVELTINGVNANQHPEATTNSAGQATLTYTGTMTGTDTVQALAWVNDQPTYSNQVTVQWTPPTSPPTTPPIATPGWIGSPISQSTQTGSVPIKLANGITLSSGTVDYRPVADSSDVTTLATNVSGTGGATLATLDTTTLANGSYIVRLQGTNNSGTQLNSEVLITVAGQNKPGRVTFSVTDLTVPVAGLPITIGRTYDSLLRNQSGDFGNGWNLTIGSPKLTVDPAHNVSLMLPDGRRVTFYFTPRSVGGIFGFLLTPGYTPEAGVYGSLTSDGCALLAVSSGQDFCFPGTLYQPSAYTYTDPYGRTYVMDAATGTLTSVTDLDGNTLTISPQGITSSAGNLHVTFTRDSQGRITQITDPAGNVYQYSYDDAGDLVSVTLPGVATPIRYTYDATHLLQTIADPVGNPPVTTTDYPDGRLKTTSDPFGKTTTFSYDLNTNTTTITAPDGGVTTDTYDAFGMLLSQTNPLGQQTTYTYDSNHDLTSVTDPLGHITRYTYDSQGNQTSVKDPLGNITSVTYNQFGGPTMITDALLNVQSITYDATFHPSSVTDSQGTIEQYTWNDHGQPTSVTDGNGQVTLYTYDQFGNLLTQTDALGQEMYFTYDNLGRQTSRIDARGHKTIYTYDPLGHLLTVTDPLGHETISTYDADGNQVSVKDANGQITSSTYDALNRLTQTSYPDGTTTQTSYDFRGNPLTQIDQAGNVTTSVYNLLGQPASVTTASGTTDAATTSYLYDAAGRRVQITDPLGNITKTAYDDAGHALTVTDGLGIVTTTYTYDADGRISSVTDANGHTTSYLYNVRNQTIQTTYPDQTTLQQSYDGVGNLLSQTDQAGKTTTYVYDAVGQLKSVTNPLQQSTLYSYDANGNLQTITDADGHMTSYTYDADNQLIKQTWPDGSSESFSYDAVGNQTSDLLRDGHTNTSTYDALNRLSKLTYFDGTSVSYTYTHTGQQATVTDERGTTRYVYDHQDRLVQVTVPSGLTILYAYDADSNRTSMITPAGTTNYSYDADNRLASVSATGVGTTTYTYDGVGNRTAMVLPNGVDYAYGYDALNRLTSLTETLSSQMLASYTYTLDPAGNRTKVVNADGSSTSWTYDDAYRLTGETDTDPSGAATYQASYGYDGVGNRTTANINGQTISYSYNSLDQLTSTSAGGQYNYDGRGNLTQVQVGVSTTKYNYDAADRLTGVTLPTGTSISYAYDAEGQRVQQTIGSSITNYLWDETSANGDVVQETDGSGATQASYLLGNGQVLAQTRSGVTSYYLDDGQGSVRLLTNSAGAVTDSYTYDAFGNLLTSQGTTVNPYRYTGQLYDSLTGLYYLRSRSYDPTSGRFTSADTADVTLNNPTELNRYLYVDSNPVNRFDPGGHDAFDEGAAIYANIDASAEPSVKEEGRAEADVLARDAAFTLAVNARVFELVAAAEYDFYAFAHSLPPFNLNWIKNGRTGLGLAVFLDRYIPHTYAMAALNDVGIGGPGRQGYRAIATMVQTYYKFLVEMLEAADFTVIHPGKVYPMRSKNVDHEEIYLRAALVGVTWAIRDNSYALLGVSQDTICGTCLDAFGLPDRGFLGSFRYTLDPVRDVYLWVSGVLPGKEPPPR